MIDMTAALVNVKTCFKIECLQVVSWKTCLQLEAEHFLLTGLYNLQEGSTSLCPLRIQRLNYEPFVSFQQSQRCSFYNNSIRYFLSYQFAKHRVSNNAFPFVKKRKQAHRKEQSKTVLMKWWLQHDISIFESWGQLRAMQDDKWPLKLAGEAAVLIELYKIQFYSSNTAMGFIQSPVHSCHLTQNRKLLRLFFFYEMIGIMFFKKKIWRQEIVSNSKNTAQRTFFYFFPWRKIIFLLQPLSLKIKIPS